MSTKKTKAEQTPAETTAQEQKKVAVALFNQIGFETVAHFDEYIARMKQNNYNDILGTLNAALRGVSQRGGFTLEESEAVSVAIRHLNAAFSVVEEPANDTAKP